MSSFDQKAGLSGALGLLDPYGVRVGDKLEPRKGLEGKIADFAIFLYASSNQVRSCGLLRRLLEVYRKFAKILQIFANFCKFATQSKGILGAAAF